MKSKLPLFFVITLILKGVVQLSLLHAADGESNNPMKLHRNIISGVNDSWQVVTLPYTYDSMVVICTVNYPLSDS